MSNLFANQNPGVSQRKLYESKYNSARMNLLLVLAFTAVNIILLLTGSYTYFLFSASIPYFLVDMGMLLCGKYPPEVYVGELAGMEFLPVAVLVILTIIAVLILAAYVLCWVFSKKKVGWLMAALVLFVIDTLGMFILYGISFDSIIDILFHAWVIWYLVSGIRAHNALMKLPAEEPVYEADDGYITVDPVAPANNATSEEESVATENEPSIDETANDEATEAENSENT